VTFTIGDKAWQTARPIESNDADASAPQIAVNANGNALAARQQLRWHAQQHRREPIRVITSERKDE
jgi:hypothetical protein